MLLCAKSNLNICAFCLAFWSQTRRLIFLKGVAKMFTRYSISIMMLWNLCQLQKLFFLTLKFDEFIQPLFSKVLAKNFLQFDLDVIHFSQHQPFLFDLWNWINSFYQVLLFSKALAKNFLQFDLVVIHFGHRQSNSFWRLKVWWIHLIRFYCFLRRCLKISSSLI
jgi:hypothetical protein